LLTFQTRIEYSAVQKCIYCVFLHENLYFLSRNCSGRVETSKVIGRGMFHVFALK